MGDTLCGIARTAVLMILFCHYDDDDDEQLTCLSTLCHFTDSVQHILPAARSMDQPPLLTTSVSSEAPRGTQWSSFRVPVYSAQRLRRVVRSTVRDPSSVVVMAPWTPAGIARWRGAIYTVICRKTIGYHKDFFENLMLNPTVKEF